MFSAHHHHNLQTEYIFSSFMCSSVSTQEESVTPVVTWPLILSSHMSHPLQLGGRWFTTRGGSQFHHSGFCVQVNSAPPHQVLPLMSRSTSCSSWKSGVSQHPTGPRPLCSGHLLCCRYCWVNMLSSLSSQPALFLKHENMKKLQHIFSRRQNIRCNYVLYELHLKNTCLHIRNKNIYLSPDCLC